MKQAITAYHKDDQYDWVAELACGHFQHVRNKPPWVNRPWVETSTGRNTMLGYKLNCKKCDKSEPKDSR
ncbi:MAG: DUF3565 domain-containing protein [Gammaproteobacteria bacterium]|jgi:hypothetical protein|nr:DUF3565 domain-containing protein [Gammaproteobacteria bacterium]